MERWRTSVLSVFGSERVVGGVSSSLRALSRGSWRVASKRSSGARISASIVGPEPLLVPISFASTGLPLAYCE